MNIFAIDQDPVRAAQQLHDRHVVKMIVETGQMLSTARRFLGHDETGLMRNTHINHPSNVWLRTSAENYRWALDHFLAMCHEYTYRFLRLHKTFGLVHLFAKPLSGFPEQGLTPFALAMPENYKTSDPVESYRAYYLGDKIRGARWTNRTSDYLDPWLRDHVSTDQYKVNLKRLSLSFPTSQQKESPCTQPVSS